MFKLEVQNWNNYTDHDDSSTKMRPDVHSLIMKLKQTFKHLTIGVKIDSVPSKEFVVPHVFWSLVKGPYIRFWVIAALLLRTFCSLLWVYFFDTRHFSRSFLLKVYHPDQFI